MLTDLERLFPRLRGANCRITSSVAAGYNCIAWAAGDTLRWWWPELDVEHGYWPDGAPHDLTLAAFAAAFATLGYEPTDQHAWEQGWEKIAWFALLDGMPTRPDVGPARSASSKTLSTSCTTWKAPSSAPWS